MRYRDDIDGLRAVAILPVIGYHFDLGIAPGGFVGVDVFFVISGYLITRLIYDEMMSGGFSLLSFYDRRIRRIIPALLVVMAFSLAVGFFISFPYYYKEISATTLAVVTFASNLYFYMTSEYFDATSQRNPLLHTWSLAVEEQFYIFLPLLLFVLVRYVRRHVLAALAIIAAASLVASVIAVEHDRMAAFYLPQFRAWELLIGSLLAVGRPRQIPTYLASSVGIVGLGAIVASIGLLSSSSPFPGMAALPACLGAGAVIYSGHSGGLAARLLRAQPLPFVGWISYSLYLWHWPLVVFSQQLPDPMIPSPWVLLVATFALATASWRFVEQPFRVRSARWSSRSTIRYGIASMAILVAAAFVARPVSDAYWHADEIDNALKYLKATIHNVPDQCFLYSGKNDFSLYDKTLCLNIERGKVNILVFGDSHAAHLVTGLKQRFPQINFMIAASSGCRPGLRPVGEKRCTEMGRYIVDDFLRNEKVDGVLISGRWLYEDLPGLYDLVGELKRRGDNVMISGPINEYKRDLPILIADYYAGKIASISDYSNVGRFKIDQQMADALKDKDVYYNSPLRTLCSGTECLALGEGNTPVQFDINHLTDVGSHIVAMGMDGRFFEPHGIRPLGQTH